MRVHTDLSSLPTFRNAVVTIGSFDGVHLGHRRILEDLKQLADQINGETVVVTFDPHPRSVLKPEDGSFRLISTTREKTGQLDATGIDHLIIVPFNKSFAQLSADEYITDFLISKINPKYIVIGYDHRFGASREGNIDLLRKYALQHSFEVVEIPAEQIDEITISSSKIRKALDASEIELANKLLGRPFSFSGTVVHGDHIGRTIGFPTANIRLEDPNKLILPHGIYASDVLLPDGSRRTGALYIGNRPSVETGGAGVIEVHISGFEGDLYGQDLEVEVLGFIRPDMKFDSLEALKSQMASDVQEIFRRFGMPVFPSVAIVILNYNTSGHLRLFLPSVLAHAEGARVIVADNGSPDDSLEVLAGEFPQVEVIALPKNYGFARGYNEALKLVSADYYVILNSDVEVSEGWLSPIIRAMETDRRIGVAQPKILQWDEEKQVRTRQFEHAGASGGWIDSLGYPFCRGRIFTRKEEDQGQYDDPQECFWATGAAFFIRAELYHRYGGFDGDYFAHNEEIDLCWRLKRAGYSVWCFPQSVVWHLGGGTLEYESPRKVFLNFRNSLFSIVKNEHWLKVLWLVPVRLVLDGVAGARYAAKGQFAAIRAVVSAHFSFYAQLGNTLVKRRQADAIIRQKMIGKENTSGIYHGSIVVAHYLRRIIKFSDL